MVRGMARSRLQYDGSIAEYVMLILRDDYRLGVLESTVVGGFCTWRRRIGKHDFTLELSNQPGRCWCEQVGIPDMVPVKMRKREIRNVGRCKSDLRQLGCQPLGGSCVSQRCVRSVRLEAAVRNRASIPHEHSFWMCDQEARNGHFGACQFFLLQLIRRCIGDIQAAAIEHVEAHGLWRLRLCALLRYHKRCDRQERDQRDLRYL